MGRAGRASGKVEGCVLQPAQLAPDDCWGAAFWLPAAFCGCLAALLEWCCVSPSLSGGSGRSRAISRGWALTCLRSGSYSRDAGELIQRYRFRSRASAQLQHSGPCKGDGLGFKSVLVLVLVFGGWGGGEGLGRGAAGSALTAVQVLQSHKRSG